MVEKILFEKCPVCKKGKVKNPKDDSFISKLLAFFNSKKYTCDKCNSIFDYTFTQKLTNYEFYKLKVSQNEMNKKFDGKNFSKQEWEIIQKINQNVIEIMEKTGKLPEFQFEIQKFLLEKEEKSVWFSSADLNEERMIRHYNAGHAGLKLGKGMYVGKTQGTSESKPELKLIDSGELLLTTKRLLFNGQYKNYSFKLKEINYIEQLDAGFGIGKINRQKASYFVVDEPEKWVKITQKAISLLK